MVSLQSSWNPTESWHFYESTTIIAIDFCYLKILIMPFLTNG